MFDPNYSWWDQVCEKNLLLKETFKRKDTLAVLAYVRLLYQSVTSPPPPPIMLRGSC